MKNVLLPTDLTVQSLRPVHDIVKDAKGRQITIRIVHLISLPTSITDLLFIDQNKPYREIPENFKEALQLLSNKYQGFVEKIVFDFVYCQSARYFNNFIEGNKIDAVYMLSDYNYQQTLRQSEKIIPYLDKCRLQVRKLPLPVEAFSEYESLSALLNSIEPVKKPELNRTAKTTISYS